MKKQLKYIQGLFVFALLLSVVLGCKFWAETSGGDTNGSKGNTVAQNKNSDSEKSSDKDEKTAKGELAKDIIGTWNGGEFGSDEKLTLTFKKDGSLDIETDFGDEKVPVEATYKIIDEQIVEIQYDDGKTRKLTDIKISGDTMQTNGRKGKLGTFQRVSGKTKDSESSSDDDI